MSVVVNIENQQVVLKLSVEGSSAARAISAANRAEQSASDAEQYAGVSVENANRAESAADRAEDISSPIIFNHIVKGNIILEASVNGWDQNFRELGNIIFDAEMQKYILVYSGFIPPYSETGAVFIGIATSEDGKTWIKGGSNGDGLAFDIRYGEDPYLVKKEGIYYIYFENKSVVPQTIDLCTSTDLINWEYRGVVLERSEIPFESMDVSSPTILIENAVWYMFYEGRVTGTNQGAVGLAISEDGLVWDKYANNPIITGTSGNSDILWAADLVPDDIFIHNGLYYLSFHARQNQILTYRPGIAVSTDLLKWYDNIGSYISIEDIPGSYGNGLMMPKINREKYGAYISDVTQIKMGLLLSHSIKPSTIVDISGQLKNGFYFDANKNIYSGIFNGVNGLGGAGVIKNPLGGSLKSTSSLVNGSIKIFIPYEPRMITIKGTVYNYLNNTSFSFYVSCYTRQAVDTSVRYTAKIIGGDTQHPVKIYREESNNYGIYIGDNYDWRFVHVNIDEVLLSQGNLVNSILETPLILTVTNVFTGSLIVNITDTFPNANLSQKISGYTLGSNTSITSSDSLLTAIGKLQAQINGLK